jgi:DNA invertase Pin-like site-specific DNA recombinase
LISARTRDALAAAKARGVRLGNRTNLGEAQRRAVEARKAKADQGAANILPVIEEVRRQGAGSLRQIADALNARGLRTPSGAEWSAMAVKRVLDRD